MSPEKFGGVPEAPVEGKDASREAGVEAYKDELRKYKQWLDGVKGKYSFEITSFDQLDRVHAKEAAEWNRDLAKMRESVEMTQAEEDAIDKEILG
jgi:hypothetical protein